MADSTDVRDPDMHKRETIMADGRRYMIFYTFEPDIPAKHAAQRDVTSAADATKNV